MRLSAYFITFPYFISWKAIKLFQSKKPVIDFYISEMGDFFNMEAVINKFPSSRVVARNNQISRELEAVGVQSINWPTFPDVVIMARHDLHKYPIKNIVKVGMEHGPYVFKNFIAAKKYNAFQRFLKGSQDLVTLGQKIGIRSAVAIGYPKLDQAFNGKIDDHYLKKLRNGLNQDPAKPTILFSATWDKSGMSAIHKWHDRIDELSDRYNIMVTLHPFMSQHYKKSLQGKTNIHYITSHNNVPYLMLADILISDTSSIIAEYCALNKPIITFKVEKAKRLNEDIKALISSISIGIDSFDELDQAIKKSLTRDTLAEARAAANKKFFYALDGKAADRAALEIMKVLEENHLG